MHNNLKKAIEKRLHEPLPGKEAHAVMRPEGRELEMMSDAEPRKSAVLVLLFSENENLKITLIKRAEYDGIHSGQLAFPGGKQEPTDQSLRETALREAYEEVGVHESDIDILGKLSTLYIPISNMEVHPFVGMHKNKPIFVKQDKEVQQVLIPNLNDFLDYSHIRTDIFEGLNYKVQAPCYTLNNFKVWGATAMIMSEFVQIFKEISERCN